MLNFNVIKKSTTESTNTDLKALARKGAPVGTVIIAESQSGGKGRMNRSFSSHKGGLYMSLLLPFDTPDSVGLITTYAAVATAHAIERLAPISVKIKWVNDLLACSKKICGILAEGVCREDGNFVVLGIGVNLTGKIPDELSPIAATVRDLCGCEIHPLDLAKEILSEFADFDKASLDSHIDEYRHRCMILGKSITVIPHSSATYGARALDITNNGGLLVRREGDGATEALFSGEVSVREGGAL